VGELNIFRYWLTWVVTGKGP